MAFNDAMTSQPTPELHPDAQLIDQLGGPAILARALGFDMSKGTQRVQNWKYRGIPELMKLRHPSVFQPSPEAGEGVADAA